MARYGINPKNTYGVSIPKLRKTAKETGQNHQLAHQLWKTEIHEAQILASMVANPEKVTETQMERWAKDFDSWDVCDQCCLNLFKKTKFSYQKVVEWSSREELFVKRAGFVLMACLAAGDKTAADNQFIVFLPFIQRAAGDNRNLVKKAVNWALRQIGKRNLHLNKEAIAAAKTIQKFDSRSARWIASDAIRELTSMPVKERLHIKSKGSKL